MLAHPFVKSERIPSNSGTDQKCPQKRRGMDSKHVFKSPTEIAVF